LLPGEANPNDVIDPSFFCSDEELGTIEQFIKKCIEEAKSSNDDANPSEIVDGEEFDDE
jgi:hypothetical protein